MRSHATGKGREVKLCCRVPCSFDACMELGLDPETWIENGLVDIAVVSSSGGWQLEMDVERAVTAAGKSGALVYVGSAGTYKASPQEGYESGQPSLRRAIALNGYRQGAAGIHLFNHDYANHRAQPVAEGDASDMPLIESPPLYTGLPGCVRFGPVYEKGPADSVRSGRSASPGAARPLLPPERRFQPG